MEEKKIIDYVIIDFNGNSSLLRTEVLEYIKKGYVPLGGATTVYRSGGHNYYIQTMVKYEK